MEETAIAEELVEVNMFEQAIKLQRAQLRSLQNKKVNALVVRNHLVKAHEEIEATKDVFSGIFCDSMLRECIAKSLEQLAVVICDFELDPDYWEKQIQDYRSKINT